MDLHLAGKRALVTGSSSGIGRGIATMLAQEGATVVVHGRNRERSEAVAAEIRCAGGVAHVSIGDLATDQGAASVAKAVLDQTDGIDILVNNVGGLEGAGGPKPSWFDVLPEHWAGSMQQNVIAAVRMIHAMAPAMRARGWGRVINIAAVGGFQPTLAVPEYCAAKAALINLSLSLARALARSGVTVNTISPGFTRTEMFEKVLETFAAREGWPEDYETREERFIEFRQLPVAATRFGRPDDIGALVAFLCSPFADTVTGANYRIDSGVSQSVN